MSLTIHTTINGKSVSAGAEPSTSLLDFLRDTLEYKGTKLCCNTGECGACSIIYNDKPINSCVTLAADANGAEITTIEGVADGDKLHPVQQAFIDTGGGRHRRSGLREHLSLHRLYENRRCNPTRRRQNGREGLSHGKS